MKAACPIGWQFAVSEANSLYHQTPVLNHGLDLLKKKKKEQLSVVQQTQLSPIGTGMKKRNVLWWQYCTSFV